MQRAAILILSLLLMTAFSTVQVKKKVIFFGDSITQAGVQPGGYIVELKKLFENTAKGETFDLSGAGIGGNKVYDLYLRLENDVLNKNPDIVVIWVGVNDVWHKRTHGTGTDADKFEGFYNALIKKLKDRKIRVIICTPAVIGEKTDHTNELDGDLNKYAQIIRNIAKNNAVQLLDLRKIFLEYNLKHNSSNKESGILTTDRVHLNEKGNQLVAEAMKTALMSTD